MQEIHHYYLTVISQGSGVPWYLHCTELTG